ncbi:hypothetical protein G7Y89_g15602 [Cudoniella acicularis]|uniref:Uncharacterized protein n=1 Tax=Cudoniella acicularis TaxID=354080 RepID=A0A8H4VIS1_9HELO|nr:hypothetical protein G7Y89_g15602 [Cudoniella acicularis]
MILLVLNGIRFSGVLRAVYLHKLTDERRAVITSLLNTPLHKRTDRLLDMMYFHLDDQLAKEVEIKEVTEHWRGRLEFLEGHTSGCASGKQLGGVEAHDDVLAALKVRRELDEWEDKHWLKQFLMKIGCYRGDWRYDPSVGDIDKFVWWFGGEREMEMEVGSEKTEKGQRIKEWTV